MRTQAKLMTVYEGTDKRRNSLVSSEEHIIDENHYDRLKRLESKYIKIYDTSPEMHLSIGPDGSVLDCNGSYVDGLGYSSKDEIIGHSIIEHTVEESHGITIESVEECLNGGKSRNKEVWLKRKDGSIYPVLINSNSYYDEQKGVVACNTVLTDLTRLHFAVSMLQKANDEIKKTYEMKEQFINIAAHELRTPITPILIFAEMAKQTPEENEMAWQIVRKEAKRLKKLADNILDVAKIESDQLSYEFRRVRINEIITEVISSSSYSVDGKGGNTPAIIVNLKHDLELSLDPIRIGQALANILNNAIKFTKEGQITIETHILESENTLEIRITDTGPGIPEDILPKLFTKFVTKASKVELNKQGTGLGLFIAKSIIESHGGQIAAFNNDNGLGATFVITLPILKEQSSTHS